MLRDEAKGYRRDIDGLRAVAVTSVVLYHLFPAWVPGGFVGVDIFFLISGYLISRIIWDGLADGTFRFGQFYARRVRRIFPALAIVLVSALLCGASTLYFDELAMLGKHTVASVLFVVNVVFKSEGGYFDIAAERKQLLHLWSLSIEEQFYLVWPLLLYIIFRWGRSFIGWGVCLFVASFSFNVIATNQDPAAAFFNPLARCWELVLGALVGWIVGTYGFVGGGLATTLSLLGGGMLVASLFLLSKSLNFPGWIALLPACGTGLLLVVHPSSWVSRNVLSLRLLVGIGLISYPLYLWHWPLFSFAYTHFHGVLSVEIRTAILVSSLVLAAGTYLLVERPVRTRCATTRVAVALVAGMGIVGVAGYASWVSDGFVRYARGAANAPYVTEHRTIDDWLKDVRGDKCHLMSVEVHQHPEDCIEQGRPQVVLWGDSFAAALYPGLRELQRSRPFALAQLTSSACPPLPDVPSNRPNCDKVNATILETAKKLAPEIVILGAAWKSPHYPLSNEEIVPRLRTELRLLAAELKESKLVLVGPLLPWGRSMQQLLVDYLSTHGLPPPRYLPMPSSKEADTIIELDARMKTIAAEAHVTYISPIEIFCHDGKCLTRVSDTIGGLLTVDVDGHLNPEASIVLVASVADAIMGR